MDDLTQLMPNKWVTETVLVAITGMKPGTIKRARESSWAIGREYIHVSPEGEPKPNSECMYNHQAINTWIERQIKKQPR
ncbi:excisionase family protein [Proteus sp. FZP2095]|uniref:excisionase family protein n=1 Tax=Proteus sp. FZP2095 TaxID=2950158 RepID=UPI00203341E3|nr:excisionase family protein [Proteus sp. FZP2095]MCM2366696.1 excisionase family protein [Proteus sp. FZP2095]